MRTFILIAGFVLVSATAQAGEKRSLSLGPIDTPTATAPARAADATKTAEAPQAAEAPRAEAPKYIERPAMVEPKAVASNAETARVEQEDVQPARPAARKTASARKAGKPRRRHYWSEARIIHELHRHGIYW